MKLSEEEKLSQVIESVKSSGGFGQYNQFALPLVRRSFPTLFANKIVGVQPIQQNTMSQLLQNQHNLNNGKRFYNFKLNPKKERKRLQR